MEQGSGTQRQSRKRAGLVRTSAHAPRLLRCLRARKQAANTMQTAAAARQRCRSCMMRCHGQRTIKVRGQIGQHDVGGGRVGDLNAKICEGLERDKPDALDPRERPWCAWREAGKLKRWVRVGHQVRMHAKQGLRSPGYGTPVFVVHPKPSSTPDATEILERYNSSLTVAQVLRRACPAGRRRHSLSNLTHHKSCTHHGAPAWLLAGPG